jgi:hypothetical protein
MAHGHWIVGIDSQSRFGRIHHFAPGIMGASQAGAAGTHGFEIDETKALPPAGQNQAARASNQPLLL